MIRTTRRSVLKSLALALAVLGPAAAALMTGPSAFADPAPPPGYVYCSKTNCYLLGCQWDAFHSAYACYYECYDAYRTYEYCFTVEVLYPYCPN